MLISSLVMGLGLTRYRNGSIGELWTLSWPMIVASGANCLLLLIDRAVLAYYSQEAFNITTECFPWYVGFWFAFFSLIGVTEVFVGQNNGAGSFRRIGPIVWQMVWFALSTYLVFVPVCMYGVDNMLAHPTPDATKYMKIILLYSPISYATFGALGSFFVGRGKTKFITLLNIIALIENTVLDVLLVFGFLGLPRLGVPGAAYATLISQFTVFGISLVVFLSRSNRIKYATANIKLDLDQLKDCLSVSIPFAISSSINCFSFAFVIKVLAAHSPFNEFTVFGIAHSFYGALMFFGDGVARGVGTLCSNYIGAQKNKLIRSVLSSAFKLQTIFGVVLSITLIIFSKNIIAITFPSADILTRNEAFSLIPMVGSCLLLDGILLYLQALLLSAGDTKFIMFSNLYTFLIVVIVPAYIGIIEFGAYSKFLWFLFNLESCIRIVVFYLRYRSGVWKRIKII